MQKYLESHGELVPSDTSEIEATVRKDKKISRSKIVPEGLMQKQQVKTEPFCRDIQSTRLQSRDDRLTI